MLICGREVLYIMKTYACSWEDAIVIYKEIKNYKLYISSSFN